MMFASITNYPFLIKQSLQIVDKVHLMKYFFDNGNGKNYFGSWLNDIFYVIIRYHVDFYDGMILY